MRLTIGRVRRLWRAAGEGDGLDPPGVKRRFLALARAFGRCGPESPGDGSAEAEDAYVAKNAPAAFEAAPYLGPMAGEHLAFVLDRIPRCVRRAGADPDRREDLEQETLVRLLRLGKGFNPFRGPYAHYVMLQAQSVVRNSRDAERRRVLPGAASLQGLAGRDPDEGTADVAPRGGGEAEPFLVAAMADVRRSFELFLADEPPFKSQTVGPPIARCLLLPPGGGRLRLARPTPAWVLQEGRERTDRVRLPGGIAVAFPKSLIALRSPNPLPGLHPARERRADPAVLYRLLNRHVPVPAIADRFGVLPQTVHAWVERLEEVFYRWWGLSDAVDEDVRWLGESFSCPGCGLVHAELPETEWAPAARRRPPKGGHRSHWRREEGAADRWRGAWCEGCGLWSLDNVTPGEAIKARHGHIFPWPAAKAAGGADRRGSFRERAVYRA